MVGIRAVSTVRMLGEDNKDKDVIRLNAAKHLYLTLILLSPIHYVKVAGWNYLLSLIKYTTQLDPQGDSIDYTASHS
jgi:hypothetical protein